MGNTSTYVAAFSSTSGIVSQPPNLWIATPVNKTGPLPQCRGPTQYMLKKRGKAPPPRMPRQPHRGAAQLEPQQAEQPCGRAVPHALAGQSFNLRTLSL